jgi:hypothetical protein
MLRTHGIYQIILRRKLNKRMYRSDKKNFYKELRLKQISNNFLQILNLDFDLFLSSIHTNIDS